MSYYPQVNTLKYEVWQGNTFIDVFDAFDIDDCLDLAVLKYPDLDYHTFIILRSF